jgi:uncharacterized membrane protein YdjX (TVP38/TMEM64 family)
MTALQDILHTIDDPERLRAIVESLGPWGPLAVIAALAGAIVASPIPSAPIALAAGAAYGYIWGTVYVVLGAELGALIAFWIARRFGYEPVRRIPWVARWLDRARSQRLLAGLVFVSRLLPFLSFDAVSYAAGLTPLRAHWFALATFAGVVPISLLLVWSGERMAAEGTTWIATAVLLAGGITLLPLIWRKLRRG